MLVAFFGLLYHVALRPEEAAAICREHLAIPAEGWGELHLTSAVPDIGGEGPPAAAAARAEDSSTAPTATAALCRAHPS